MREKAKIGSKDYVVLKQYTLPLSADINIFVQTTESNVTAFSSWENHLL